MVSQHDPAAILKAGHDGLFTDRLLFSLSLEQTPSISLVQPTAQTQNETAEEGNPGMQRRAFCCRRLSSSCPALEGVMSGQWDISRG